MTIIEIKVPDVGDVKDIDVVEVLIQAGDIIVKEQTIATLETDKASIDLPSSAAGKVQTVHIKPGDKVSEGSLVVTLEVDDQFASKVAEPVAAAPVSAAPAFAVAVPSPPVPAPIAAASVATAPVWGK